MYSTIYIEQYVQAEACTVQCTLIEQYVQAEASTVHYTCTLSNMYKQRHVHVHVKQGIKSTVLAKNKQSVPY